MNVYGFFNYFSDFTEASFEGFMMCDILWSLVVVATNVSDLYEFDKSVIMLDEKWKASNEIKYALSLLHKIKCWHVTHYE